MATDSTELTFVRCPSCRSLVPAMSTRCRMCGATLEAGEEGEVSPSEGLTDDSVQADKDFSFQKEEHQIPSLESSEPSSSMGSNGSEKSYTEDPLAAFINEVEVDGGSDANSSDAVEQKAFEGSSQDKKKDFFETLDEYSSDSGSPEGLVEENLTGSSTKESQEEPAQSEPQVIRETGRHKRGGLSFSRQSDNTSTFSEEKENFSAKEKEEKEPSEDKQKSKSRKKKQKEKNMESQEKPVTGGARPTVSGESGSGRLLGWLVSYADDRGSAIVLREGKCFVSRTKLKAHDLLIDEDGVSTPHALLTMQSEDGMLIQDLMSDEGTFIRKHDSTRFKSIEDSAVLEHGDVVRFGSVDFIVVLIPQEAAGK